MYLLLNVTFAVYFYFSFRYLLKSQLVSVVYLLGLSFPAFYYQTIRRSGVRTSIVIIIIIFILCFFFSPSASCGCGYLAIMLYGHAFSVFFFLALWELSTIEHSKNSNFVLLIPTI